MTAALEQYAEHGYASLGVVFGESVLAPLRERADRIMLEGDPRFFFQRDSATGRYGDLPRGRGWTGPGLDYRKLERLERDDLFAKFIENEVFKRVAQAVIGEEISLYRAVLFTKAAAGGTQLPWHQDGGSFWGLDKDPVLQIWTALDDAPEEAGCVELVPGSHRNGLATPLGGVIPDEHTGSVASVRVPARKGEILLIHNYVWHRSGINATGKPRRALTVCFMDAATRCRRTKRAPRTFQRVFQSRG